MKERILVIDDDSDVRDSVALVLELAGYYVETAPNGGVGLDLFSVLRFELVVTDLFMPEAEGFETIKSLRRISPTLPIIALSGAIPGRNIDFLSMACLLGATASIPKPFNTLTLLRSVTKCLNPEVPNRYAAEAIPSFAVGAPFHIRMPSPHWESESSISLVSAGTNPNVVF